MRARPLKLWPIVTVGWTNPNSGWGAMMANNLARGFLILGLGLAALQAEARAESATPDKAALPPGGPAASSSDPAALSTNFWSDWNEAKSSEGVKSLTAAVGCADKTRAAAAAAAKDGKQGIVDVAITRPEEAAKFLSEVTTSSNDTVSDAALATVINMRTSPEVRDAAAPLVAPEAQARVEEFRADLSTGIPGLPGIYLGDTAGANGGGGGGGSGGRAAMPTGYTPVSGGSTACPSR